MNVVITGKGTSGSWAIRGEQLGKAIGAVVAPMMTSLRGADVVVLVKRVPPELISAAHASGAMVVWDVVDAWPQPEGNGWTRNEALAWFRQALARVSPHLVIGATKAMAADAEALGFKAVHVPHHSRPGQPLNPVRESVQVVVYEGSPHYLGRWERKVADECMRRGWRFIINPTSIAAGDIVLALRDAGGYPASAWKSNVKLANAQGSGTPFIGVPECGYVETSTGHERFITTPSELSVALDWFEPRSVRTLASETMKAAAPTLRSVASEYISKLEIAHAQWR